MVSLAEPVIGRLKKRVVVPTTKKGLTTQVPRE